MIEVIRMGAIHKCGHILCQQLLLFFHLSSQSFLLGLRCTPLQSKELASVEFRSFYNLQIDLFESIIYCQLLLEPSQEMLQAAADPPFENEDHVLDVFGQNLLQVLL